MKPVAGVNILVKNKTEDEAVKVIDKTVQKILKGEITDMVKITIQSPKG